MKQYKTITKFLSSYSSDHINYACCNLGGIDLAVNLAKSCRLQDLPFVFFALDIQALERMKGLCDTVNATELEYNNLESITYGTKDFNWISFSRYPIAKLILESGRSLSYLDIDIIVKNNFQPDILSKLNENPDHMLIQSNHLDKPCTGFFNLSPHFDVNVIDFFLKRGSDEHDQDFLHSLLLRKKIKIKLLEKDLYPNGAWYYNNLERVDKTSNIIHFNCIRGNAQKLERMKLYNYYYE
jgi:lipopolysaccharide biosynthesis glycosyltransferase